MHFFIIEPVLYTMLRGQEAGQQRGIAATNTIVEPSQDDEVV